MESPSSPNITPWRAQKRAHWDPPGNLQDPPENLVGVSQFLPRSPHHGSPFSLRSPHLSLCPSVAPPSERTGKDSGQLGAHGEDRGRPRAAPGAHHPAPRSSCRFGVHQGETQYPRTPPAPPGLRCSPVACPVLPVERYSLEAAGLLHGKRRGGAVQGAQPRVLCWECSVRGCSIWGCTVRSCNGFSPPDRPPAKPGELKGGAAGPCPRRRREARQRGWVGTWGAACWGSQGSWDPAECAFLKVWGCFWYSWGSSGSGTGQEA